MSPYQVDLEVYQGPLDLLLRLIERQELDITAVSLAVVTDQYLAYLARVRERSAAQLASFLQVAGRLIVIKSRVLLPRPEEDDGEEELLGDEDDLVAQLREYKRFKDLAGRLREIEESGRKTYARATPPPRPEPRLKAGEVSVDELVSALQQLLDAQPETRPVDGIVSPIEVHIGDCANRILDRVSRYPRARFSTLLHSARSRLEIIVTFLALLELIKQQRVRVTQDRAFGEIYLEGRVPDPALQAAEADDLQTEDLFLDD